jgi:Arc/MetJ-type ribon-helix-helix transcriptional regulator
MSVIIRREKAKVKKHVYLPAALDSSLKSLVEKGYFVSEAEALRTAVTLLLANQRQISADIDYVILNEISEYIQAASERAKDCKIELAIEQMSTAADMISTLMTISLMTRDNEDFITNIRTLNIIFTDCLSVLRKIVENNSSKDRINELYKEYELTENLDFLQQAYKEFANVKREELKLASNSTDRNSNHIS